ncbi:MAG TPA: class I SAM-dependent methyltransferase [Pseudonocardia sp.]|jgi:SAM-dependent methyltransferase|nr:class I SAM-dependent methyltransferase [Pseudonocardia sp.]
MADHQQTPPAADAPQPVTRGRTFGAVAQAYAAFRPDYPNAALDWALAPLAGRSGDCGPVLLDLAAGTGKLTASLVHRSSQVTAIEPDPEMLAVLHAQLPEVTALAGSAEDIPLPEASVDAVLVGQAFHWFDPERAGAEIARVLRPGGVLAALWNSDDDSVDWVAGYFRAASRERAVPGVPSSGAREDLPRLAELSASERAEFPHSQRLTVEGLVDVLGTHSWALISTPEEREAAFDRVRRYFAERPELVTGPDGVFEMPLCTLVLRALRVAERR